MSKEKKKGLSCAFWDDVSCEFQKGKRTEISEKCLGCSEYKRFEREMERQEDEFWEADETLRKSEGA